MDTSELKRLVENYRPNAEVLEAVAQIRLLATVGPTATGKTTVAKALVDSVPGFHFVLGETSRPARPGEEPGVDYLFRNREEIIEDLKAGRLVDVVLGAHGDLYSTRVSSYSKDGVSIMALIPPAIQKYRELPLKSLEIAFIVPSSYENWQKWLALRQKEGQWSAEQLGERLAEAKNSLNFALNDGQISFVLNDQINSAAKRLLQVSGGQQPDGEAQAKTTAAENYKRLLKEG